MEQFNKRYILNGEISVGRDVLAKSRCELKTNKIDADYNTVVLSAFEGDLNALIKSFGSKEGFKFVCNDENEVIEVDADFVGLNLTKYDDEVMNARARKIKLHQRHAGGQPTNAMCWYYLQPAYSYLRKSGSIYRHPRRGLLFGWTGWKSELNGISNEAGKVEQEWTDECFELPCNAGKAVIANALLFNDGEKDPRPTYQVVDHLILEFDIKNINMSAEELLVSLDNEVNQILVALSFVDGEFIDWSYSRLSSYDAGKKEVEEIGRYQFARKRNREHIDEGFFRSRGPRLRKTHGQMVTNLRSMSKDKQGAICGLIDRFVVACRQNISDIRLVYLHSCLDVLLQYCGATGSSFSKRLANVCLANKIGWEDLYPGLTKDVIEHEKGDFRINRLRNDMLHHGIHPKDYSEIFEEERRARALAERLILMLLDIDYVDSGLGQIRIF